MQNPLLKKILTQPTAPFREKHVIATISQTLAEAGVPFFSDRVGNLIIGAASETEYLSLLRQRSSEPVRVFIAHMDHPGFHGTAWRKPDELEIKWHGGSPTAHLENAKVWLATADGSWGDGRILEAKIRENGRAVDTALVHIETMKGGNTPDAAALYGGFAFRAPCWQDGELIYTKAADDLVGSFAIVALALKFLGTKGGKNPTGKAKKPAASRPPLIGLLTRAEEVGFIGAIGHFELGYLQKARRPVLCVSLETSRALPGAEIGKGPVVRLGDKFTVFDSGALRIFTELAQKELPDRHQRRVMDGGTCEATAATVYGFPCVGISVPLGNYHNQSFEGGPDSAGPNGPAPEFVHEKDIAGLIALCQALLKPKLPWQSPWAARQKEFKKELRGYQSLLRSGP